MGKTEASIKKIIINFISWNLEIASIWKYEFQELSASLRSIWIKIKDDMGYITPTMGKTIVEAQRYPTTGRDGLETTHLAGMSLGKLRMQTGPLFLPAPAPDLDKVWGEDSWLERGESHTLWDSFVVRDQHFQTKAIVQKHLLNHQTKIQQTLGFYFNLMSYQSDQLTPIWGNKWEP